MNSNAFRTHTSGMITDALDGQQIVISGWVHRRRDHGGLLFFDLRDHQGLLQVVCDPEHGEEMGSVARTLRSEFVVRVHGTIRCRPADAMNKNLSTGAVELHAESVEILNECDSLPFQVDDPSGANVGEELRLTYRYLDLRRPDMRKLLVLRHEICRAMRDALNDQEFLEIETPVLMKSTPEGARDFLVPSRLYAGKFYALPQSPQLYKQILMVAGMERYYQLARCFRDEDLRADRQPEFTQLDLEMSFVDQEDVFRVIETMMVQIVKEVRGLEIVTPFERLTYHEAVRRFGLDKPDLRFGLELGEVTEGVAASEFGVFRNTVANGGIVGCIALPGGGERSRREIEELEKIAKIYGAKGLAWFKLEDGEAKGGISKFLNASEVSLISSAAGATDGDAVLLVADKAKVVRAALGNLRNHIGSELNLIDSDALRFVWITDFPLFEESAEGGWDPCHHMFTMPNEEDLPKLESDPGEVKAQLYDLVLNGWELGSGSIRVHRAETQRRIMGVVGMSEEEAERRFGFLLKALHYGAPPHGGIALGLDRLVTLLAEGQISMRDVIPFPKTLSAVSLMDECPSAVDLEQLDELSIRVVQEEPS